MADAVGLSRVSSSERRLKAISAHICQTNNSHASSSVKKSEQEIKQDKLPPPDTPHHVTFPLKNKMGKPRMIILIRHAQSEGNKNRDIHQYVPDHRVRLTPDGQLQAEDAGRRLRDLLKPDDTIQFFTSPYRRTRETTEGILRTLTSNDEQLGPSPFPRDKIKVYEEPRLREQDFGNFQPCSAEMERMWQERADYGHFFYRIPNGESAADAYDRVSGFNESLWRQFGESDFPSVCVLVTHGLMTRVFLMKWYHWSVEYFEDLRNINHCEFIIMKQNYDNGKYILQNELRTWSDLKRRAAVTNNVSSISLKAADPKTRMWGGCAMGCNHAHMDYPKRPRRQNTLDFIGGKAAVNEKEDHPVTSQDADLKKKGVVRVKTNLSSKAEADVSPTSVSKHHHQHENHHQHVEEDSDADPSKGTPDGSDADDADADSSSPIASPKKSYSGLQLPLRHKGGRQTSLLTKLGRDGGGSKSGLGSPNDISDEADDSDWFDTNVHQLAKRMSISQTSRSEITRSALSQINETMSSSPPKNGGSNVSPLRSRRSGSLTRSGSHGGGTKRSGSASATKRRNTKSEQEMIEESGMNGGRRADALGDVDEDEVDANDDVEEAKIKDRKSLSEVY